MAYSKIERHTWDDERFRRYTRDVRFMWLYLLSCKHSNRIGLFVLDPLTAAGDLSSPDDEWDRGRVLECWRALYREGRMEYDPDTRLVFLKNHLKHNHPENPNVVKAGLDQLRSIPFAKRLWEGFREGLIRHVRMVTERGAPFGQPWLDYVDQRLDEARRNAVQSEEINRSANRSANGIGNGMPNHEPEPEPYITTPPIVPPHGGTETEKGVRPIQRTRRKKPVRERPEDWKPNESHRKIAANEGVDVDTEAERFCLHHDARGNLFADWDKAFHTWLRRAKEYAGPFADRGNHQGGAVELALAEEFFKKR